MYADQNNFNADEIYYKTLNVPINAGLNEIKKSYRSQSIKYYPNINNNTDSKNLMK